MIKSQVKWAAGKVLDNLVYLSHKGEPSNTMLSEDWVPNVWTKSETNNTEIYVQKAHPDPMHVVTDDWGCECNLKNNTE